MDRNPCTVDFPPDLREKAEAVAGKESLNPEFLSPEEILKLIHDLRVDRSELELRNEMLRKACEDQASIAVGRERPPTLGGQRLLPPVEENRLFLAILVQVGLLFLVDAVFPFEFAIWVFYSIPLFMALRSSRKGFSYLTVLIISATIVAGLFIGPLAIPFRIAVLNRMAQIAALWIIAVLLERYRFTRQLQALNEELAAARDLAEQRAHEAEEGQRMLDGIMKFTPEGIQVIATDHRIIHHSEFLESLSGYPKEALQGITIEERLRQIPVYHPDGKTPARAEELPTLRALHGGEVVKDEEWAIQTAQGDLVRVSINAGPLRDSDGAIIGAVSTWHDITERKRVEDALRESEESIRRYAESLRRKTAQLEASNKELEAFSYSISHDLRAPLRSIDGFSRVLGEDFAAQLGDEGRDYLERIRAAAQRMANLIEDMLNLSRTVRAEMHFGEVNLSELAREVVRDLRQAEPDRRVEVNIQDDVRAEGDETLLRQVLQNLLGNAWKFTSKTPSARIEFGEIDPDGKRVYYVRDNGAGFDMNYANNLFTPFRRLHTESEFPGTGIGLSIVKRIVARHGGAVRAEGEPGQGATFYFTLRPEE